MTNNGKHKAFSMNLENFFRHRRMPLPKRSAEFIALIAVSCTLFLFLHTKTLTSRLQEMEERLAPSELSSTGLSESGALHNELLKPEMKGVHKTYQYLKSTGQLKNIPSTFELNNTRKAQLEIVLFNRVPKVGSQSMMALLKRLARINDFEFTRDPPSHHEKVLFNPEESSDFAEEIVAIENAASYSKHMAYINFTAYDQPKPIYINLIRDPIERVISWYYYVRTPWYFVQRKSKFPQSPMPDPQWLRMDLEACLERKVKDCTFKPGEVEKGGSDHRRQTLFFCGQDKEVCMPFDSPKAMQRAKHTVESEYAVVGSWEDTNITLTVLEHYIPRFFRGATAVYYHAKDDIVINGNKFKPYVSEEVKNQIRKNFTHEIEFYKFCKQRLYNQYAALKKENRI